MFTNHETAEMFVELLLGQILITLTWPFYDGLGLPGIFIAAAACVLAANVITMRLARLGYVCAFHHAVEHFAARLWR